MLLLMIKYYTKKIFAVAMSGGVDSSTTALLLKKQGYNLMGFFMRLVDKQTIGEAAARRVSKKLGIKFYTIDLSKQFKKLIIDYFLTGYRTGLTPNPCVRCNQLIKFGELLRVSRNLGADCLATGHYVTNVECRMSNVEFEYKLLKAKDKTKDQSYFLYTLTQKQLAQILFPLGNYTKKQVRQIANRAKLPYLKQESQDICFLAGQEVNNFLCQNLKLTPGPIILAPLKKGGRGVSKVMGQHQGLPLYTIGQRRGVNIGGSGPYYVAKMDYQTNTLYVVKDANDPALLSHQLIAINVTWLSGKPPRLPFACQAVIRYRQPAVKCLIAPLACPLRIAKQGGRVKGGRGVTPSPYQGEGWGEVLVKFSKPLRAVTAGQSVVFYHGNQVLGGGIIK